MEKEPSAVRVCLLSERGLSGTDAQVYRSASGEYNYYPTSTHKRQHPAKQTMGEHESPCIEAKTERPKQSPSQDAAHCGAVSPSSAGLSRSPSQLVPEKQSVTVRRSVSQPVSRSPTKSNDGVKPTRATGPLGGGAPLLHRYRTSHVAFPHQESRSHSAASPLSAVDGNRAKKVTYVRRSLLPSAAATQRKTLLSDAASASDSRTTPSRPPTLGDAVPVACVRLVETTHSNASAADKPTCNRGSKSSSPGANRVDQGQPRTSCTAATAQRPHGAAAEQNEKAAEATTQESGPSLSNHHLADAVLSRDASSFSVCSDVPCVHSEQSICEFIFMQRELRRCYAAMGDYEAVVAQLRQECTEAWTALHQLQRQCTQREEAVETAVRAELEEHLPGFRRSRDDAVKCTSSVEKEVWQVGEEGTAESAETKVCVETTWRETLDELQRALQAEKTAHSECRRELDEARSAESRWKSRATDLLAWRRSVCQQLDGSSPSPIDAARGPPGGTPVHSAPVSTPHRLSSVAPGTSPGLSHASSLSSPAPRRFSPPRPHQAQVIRQTQKSPMADEGVCDLSWLSALTKESSCAAGEGGRARADAAHDAGESVLSTSETSTLSQDAVTCAATEAVGSGVVLVESRRALAMGGEEEEVADGNIMEHHPSLLPFQSGLAPLAEKVLRESASKTTEVDRSVQSSTQLLSPERKGNAEMLPRLVRSGSPQQRSPAFKSRDERTAGSSQLLLAFPPPSFSNEVDDTMTNTKRFVSRPLQSFEEAATSVEGELAERRIKELLRALLDKERQLAVVAEERTRYRLLNEQQANVVL